MYFLALSHAPPPLFRNRAYRIPVHVENIRNAHIPFAANRSSSLNILINLRITPRTRGVSTLNRPGLTYKNNIMRLIIY